MAPSVEPDEEIARDIPFEDIRPAWISLYYKAVIDDPLFEPQDTASIEV